MTFRITKDWQPKWYTWLQSQNGNYIKEVWHWLTAWNNISYHKKYITNNGNNLGLYKTQIFKLILSTGLYITEGPISQNRASLVSLFLTDLRVPVACSELGGDVTIQEQRLLGQYNSFLNGILVATFFHVLVPR